MKKHAGLMLATTTLTFLALLACSSSSGGGGGGGGGGNCANVAGQHVGTMTCSDNSVIPINSTVTQSGCTATYTSNSDGTSHTYQISGNTANRPVNENGISGSCTETVTNSTLSFSCNLTANGQQVTCNGTGTFTPAATGTGGSTGTGGGTGTGGASGCSMDWGSGDANCDACMASSCCVQMQKCGSGSACAALADCIVSYCPNADQTCLQQNCAEQLNAGGQDLLDMLSCNDSSCGGC